MADVAMESEGKAAGGRVTCSCGGGGVNLQGTIFLMRRAFRKSSALKKNHGNRTPKLGNSDFGTTIKQYLNHVQELMCDRHYKIPDGDDLVLPPILFTKNATT